MDDEKWVGYDNVVRKISWSKRYEPAQSTSKADIHKKKVMLSNATRKGLILHQDNVRPHTSLVTRKKLLELGWEVMPHLPYSPDLTPSDYHLFRSLQNHLNCKTFDSNQAVKNELIDFFASKIQTFYESGIVKLTEGWQKVIEQNGQYIID